MSCSSLRTIVCQEVFDENSAPSEEEVKEYAWKIGINPDTEPHLLHYAREGLMQALPAEWKPCFDTNVQAWYYYNTATRQSQWEHPLDDVYRTLVKKVRSESISSAGEDDSKTSAKEDLKSYEEPADPSVDATSKTMDSSKSISLRKANIQLNPLKKFSPTDPVLSPSTSKAKELPIHGKFTPSSSRSYIADDSDLPNPPRIDLTIRKDTSSTGAIRKEYTSPVTKDSPPGFSPRIELSTGALFKSELRPKKEIPSPTARIDIDKMTVIGSLRQDSTSRREKLQSAQEKHPRGMTGRGELTLTGGGSIFLKSKDKPELQSPGQTSVATPTPTEGLEKQPSIEVISSHSKDEAIPKSILRDQRTAPVRQLWDVDPRQMSVEEKQLWRRQELDEERKSVRFNLDKGLDIHFTVPESDHSDQEGEEEVELYDKEEEEDWNSDDDDPEEERIILGMKNSAPVQDASDGSDRDEMSPKIIDNIFPVDDRIETQISREGSMKGIEESLFQKVDSSSNFRNPGKLSEKYFPKEVMKNRITSDIFDDTSQLSDGSVEDKCLEGPTTNLIMYKDASKEQVVGIEDVEMKQEEKMQCTDSVAMGDADGGKTTTPVYLVMEQSSDFKSMKREVTETVMLQREKMIEELSESLKQLEREHEKCKEATKTELNLKEQKDKQQLLVQMEERLALFQSSLQTQQEAQETSIREKMQTACEKVKAELEATHEKQLQEMRRQYEQRLQQEQVILEAQLAELENELASKREVHDRERVAQEEQLAEKERELASRQEALDHELTMMEDSSKQKLEDITKQLEEQSRERLEGLQLELEANNQAQLDEVRIALAADLETKRAELTAVHREELEAMRQQLEFEHRQACEQLRSSNEEELDGLRAEYEAAVLELREEHLVSLEMLRDQLRKEEEVVRREHAEKLDDLRVRLGRELEVERAKCKTTSELLDNVQQEQVDNSRMFEKLRCEKRLLEDKYRSLKEKYIRLKTDVKISIERRKKRDGGTTTGSETDRSTSHKTGKSSEAERLACDAGRSRVDTDKRTKKHSPEGLVVIDNNNASQNAASSALGTTNIVDDRQPSIVQEPKNLLGQLSLEGHDDVSSPPAVDCDTRSSTSSNYQIKPPRSTGTGDGNVNSHCRRQLFGHIRPGSAVNRASNNNSSSVEDLEEDFSPSISPVENLRRQLQKLEDLEDQFPASTHTDTYLRYPFTDTGQFGSSEMEFFRHRIHLERDSVRRAKDFLRVQRSNFLSRQRDLKQRQLDSSTTARNMLDQLYQEERELTDMEVSLHRTRSLLGEKIIRLRHLEQSLYRAAEQASPTPTPRPEDQTLSDISSHSGSSGFSSTEFATDTGRGPPAHGDHYQESSEIIQSLENLNSEIREIWEVLHKQQEGTNFKPVVTTSPLVCGDLNWPTLLVAAPTLSERVKALRQQAQQNLTAMAHFSPARPGPDPALAERTRSLREWLRQARLDSAQL